MIPMNKVQITAYRYLGGTGACFTCFQGFCWLVLALTGAVCKFVGCGADSHKGTFGYCFYLTYFYEPSENITGNFTRINMLTPIAFHAIMWVNVLMSIANLVVSGFTAAAFIQWNDTKKIRKAARIWTSCILAFSAIELIQMVVFASDIVAIKGSEDVKCLLEINLTSLRSSDMIERNPAPYLLQLKSNLKSMKKKIRKFKRNLLFLDAVFDEKSPDHVKNPFIPKKVVNNYVEDIWKDMFNNSIREKVRRKSDTTIPFDEMMRNFIINEHLDLDDMDYDLLKNFDGLTNNKWIKPIESGNVVIGAEYNLSSSLTTDDSADELDKIASLLSEYLKETETQNTTHTITDENFEEFFKELLDELENQDTHLVRDEDKAKDNDVLLSLTKIFDNMTTQEETYVDWNNAENVQQMLNVIREFLETNKTIKFSDDQILEKLKESLKYQYEFDKNDEDLELHDLLKLDFGLTNVSKKLNSKEYEGNLMNESNKFKHRMKDARIKFRGFNSTHLKARRQHTSETEDGDEPTIKPTPKPEDTKYKNEYVQKICENCAYFVLAPSIVCMVMSAKVILPWVVNVTMAIIVLYYGSKIKLKRKYKYMPCLSKNE